jgi:hypothetical protein
MPPKGRPPKKKRNISGLKNQSASSASEIPLSQNTGADNEPDINTDGDQGDDQPPNDLKDLAGSEQEDEPDSDFESDHEWKGLTCRELGKRLAAQSCAIDNNSTDTDWIPFKLRKKKGT